MRLYTDRGFGSKGSNNKKIIYRGLNICHGGYKMLRESGRVGRQNRCSFMWYIIPGRGWIFSFLVSNRPRCQDELLSWSKEDNG